MYIGVDLGGTNVRAGLVSRGKLRQLKGQPVRSHGTEKEVFADLCAVIDAVWVKGVRGIGVGVPSLVHPKTGMIFDTINIPAWKKVPLRQRLEKKYRVPVQIDNDANCFTLGEKNSGVARDCENFVGLIVGTGLGAGIVMGGRLHSGVNCGAGEFGMIPYRESILEHYASGQFFKGDGAELARAADSGDAKAIARFAEFAEHLAFAFKVILYSLAPEMIVLGGSVGRSYRHYSTPLHHHLEDFGYPSICKHLKIKTSRVKDIAVLGAASLVDLR